MLSEHTETVEFIEFNHDGKLCLTGGLNNQFIIWDVTDDGKFKFKLKVTEGPDQADDMEFVQWHPKGNVFITGGKDKLIWLING